MHSERLDLAVLCAGSPDLVEPLRLRVERFAELDELLGARRRLERGARVGAYEILRAIGEGAMGQVYEAVDTATQRCVALKICHPGRAADSEGRERFRREAAIVSALDHPAIVKVYSIEQADASYFIAMELVDGATLAELLPEGGFALADLLAVALPLADVLGLAHQRGVIHRDLKPGNVMWSRQGQLKLLDFGLAHFRQEGDVESITRSGCVLGTIPYIAPEQLLGSRADALGDLYAFGAVLYELASGRRPFDGRNVGAILDAVFQGTHVPLATLRPDLPSDFQRVVARCLERDRARRPASAGELLSTLGQIAMPEENGLSDRRRILVASPPGS